MNELEEKLLEKLPHEPFEALEKLCLLYRDENLTGDFNNNSSGKRTYADIARSFSITASLLLRRANLGVGLSTPSMQVPSLEFMQNVDRYFTTIETFLAEERINRELVRRDKEQLKSEGFVIELEPEDVSKIQNDIDSLRNTIQQAEYLTESHKRRLLIRLEKMQVELHKSVSDYDAFWGGVIDAADTLSYVGEKAKPLVDRFREIADTLWRKRPIHDEIQGPDDLPRLPGG